MLTVRPGSSAEYAPGMDTFEGFAEPPPVTVICAHEMYHCGAPATWRPICSIRRRYYSNVKAISMILLEGRRRKLTSPFGMVFGSAAESWLLLKSTKLKGLKVAPHSAI
jgi:hypothetical protein